MYRILLREKKRNERKKEAKLCNEKYHCIRKSYEDSNEEECMRTKGNVVVVVAVVSFKITTIIKVTRDVGKRCTQRVKGIDWKIH